MCRKHKKATCCSLFARHCFFFPLKKIFKPMQFFSAVCLHLNSAIVCVYFIPYRRDLKNIYNELWLWVFPAPKSTWKPQTFWGIMCLSSVRNLFSQLVYLTRTLKTMKVLNWTNKFIAQKWFSTKFQPIHRILYTTRLFEFVLLWFWFFLVSKFFE